MPRKRQSAACRLCPSTPGGGKIQKADTEEGSARRCIGGNQSGQGGAAARAQAELRSKWHLTPFIFNRFHRGTNVLGSVPGSKIGLAGVREIVELHGGAIEVGSKEGAGATFTVLLPMETA